MAASSFSRGWLIFYRDSQWVYRDNGAPVDAERPCRRCGRLPTPEGHDACLGTIDGVTSACCGHGAEKLFAV